VKLLLVFAVVALAVFNAVASPWLVPLFGLQGFWYPPFLPVTLNWMFAATGLVMGLAYFLLSGVPAALYEQFTGQASATLPSRAIWLATMLIMSWPTVQPFIYRS
jgi:hypothetical protein